MNQAASREEFYSLLRECDYVVNFGSTVAVEAMILQKDILTIKLIEQEFQTGWLKNSTPEINYTESVTEALERIKKERAVFREKQRKFLETYCGEADGKSSTRAVQLAYQLANLK